MKASQNAEDGWRGFTDFLATLKSRKEVQLYLDLFLTYEERHDLGLRFLIIQELLSGEKTQREIARHLGTSIAKITRGSNALKSISSTLKEALKK